MAGNKYYFISVTEMNGEQEYYLPIVRELDSRKSIAKLADDIAKTWYDSYNCKPKFEDEGYYHLGGLVHVSINCWREITEIEYQLLKRFI